MKETININGLLYELDTPATLSQEQKNEIIRKMGGNPQSSGCSSCGDSSPKVSSLATGCPSTPIPVGTNKTFTITAATGIGPFVFTPIIGGVRQTSSPAVSTFPYTIPGGYTFNTAGSFTVAVEVKDTCTGSVLVGMDSCTSAIIVQAKALASMTVGGCTSSISTAAPTNTCTVSVTGVDQFGTAFTPTGVTYTSGTTTVATVNSTTGVVTGINAGTTVITATSGTVTATKTITVTCAVPTCAFTMA